MESSKLNFGEVPSIVARYKYTINGNCFVSDRPVSMFVAHQVLT